MQNPPRAKRPTITTEQALLLFSNAPDAALLHQEIVAAVYGVPVATLEKARCIGDDAFPKFTRLGTRVRYRAGTVRAHLAKLEERSVA
jgi:hypothetical protein